jgi:tetrapyrrole methylase family protein/MazG family protein
MSSETDKYPAITLLAEVMARLRAPDGCPWDKAQDHQSLRPYLLEEAYEAVEAMTSGNIKALKDELGDLLLHIVFHAQMASERGGFDLNQVAQGCVDKIIRRHPHIFGQVQLSTPKEVKDNWEVIKVNNEKRSLFSGVPKTLPALLMSYRVQEKASGVGFDWDNIEGVETKFQEEWAEFQKARSEHNATKMEEEFGDMLFVLVNLGRWLNINAEFALKMTVEKFLRRFEFIEKRLAEKGLTPRQSNLKEMDELWNEAKKEIL